MTTSAQTPQDKPPDTAEIEAIVTFVVPGLGVCVRTAKGDRFWLKRRHPVKGEELWREGQTLLCVVQRDEQRVLSSRVLPILVFAGSLSGESSTEIALREHWKALSDTYIEDATSELMSQRRRDDGLFESGYLAVLQILGPRVTFGREHPDPALIQTAAQRCGLSWQACGPAQEFLALRYDPAYRERMKAASLHAWALQMRYSAGWT